MSPVKAWKKYKNTMRVNRVNRDPETTDIQLNRHYEFVQDKLVKVPAGSASENTRNLPRPIPSAIIRRLVTHHPSHLLPRTDATIATSHRKDNAATMSTIGRTLRNLRHVGPKVRIPLPHSTRRSGAQLSVADGDGCRAT